MKKQKTSLVTGAGGFTIISWIFFVLKKDTVVRDQIPCLLCRKSTDIYEASRDLHFQPMGFDRGLKILLGRSIF